jgi:hypothetical protein
MDYLKESYGGSKSQHHPEHGFCCYTIYDKEYDMYYSGMKAYQGESHPVGITYFTSSTVVDFKNRFKSNPDNFDINVEYFGTLSDTVLAEKQFHIKFNVGKNPKFYNVQISGGSHCGAGTVLCAKGDGTYYRVSMQEYALGGHRHTVKGTFLVKDATDGKLKRIHPDNFDPSVMCTQFDDHVLCYDAIEDRNRRIPRSEFLSNPERFTGITKGKCVVFDRITHEKIIIDTGTINHATHYAKTRSKTIKVATDDGTIMNIDRNSYDKSSSAYKHVNALHLVRINLLDMKIQRVSVDTYSQNPNIYADLRAKYYFETPHGIFGSWRKLTKHYGTSQHKCLARVEQELAITIHRKEIIHED